MPVNEGLALLNGQAAPLEAVPRLGIEEFRLAALKAVDRGGRVCALFGEEGAPGHTRLWLLLAHPRQGNLQVFSTEVGDHYPALTPECPQVHLFERELAEQFGVMPEGHPWLKPVRFPPHGASPARIGLADFYRIEGEEVHEVAVGPVHAGIIEPGHFRFQASGEEVLHLEISLGYQHRGVERALIGGPDRRTMPYLETLAGDTTIGHATAGAQVLEALGGKLPGVRAQTLRAVALELERLANHAGDLGALAGDVGYLPTASFCGRLRGDLLNLTALACGSRFGRGWIKAGGAGFDLDRGLKDTLLERLETALKDLAGAVDLLWETPSVMARFEGTGMLTPAQAEQLGLVGPAARACGLPRDVRFELPAGKYRFSQIPVANWSTGDVFARAWVRWLEILNSAGFIRSELESLEEEEIWRDPGRPSPGTLAVSLVEGWRGEICHVALTDEAGRFAPLQGGRPLVPQLDRAGPGDARPADLGFPALQQELQPVLLRTRSLRPAMFKPLLERLRQGHRTFPFPQQAPVLPERFRGCPGLADPELCEGCEAPCLEACPSGALSPRRAGSGAGPGALPVLHRLPIGLRPGGAELQPGLPPGRPPAGGPGAAGPRPAAGRGPGTQILEPVRPLAQAPPGERRRLQCLRGGCQCAEHPDFRPGPLWRPVCRLARAMPMACW